MRLGTPGEVRSKETARTGLPKACKMWRNSANGIGASVWTPMYFDQMSFNYGGYAPVSFSGAFWSEILIPEPGIYTVMGKILFSSVPNGGYIWARITVNGADPAPFTQIGAYAPGATFPIAMGHNVHGLLELNQGDRIGIQSYAAGFGDVDIAGYTWMSIEKEGGQY